ncbi:deaminase [Vibrio spartinae]|nr:deaminase [Vibrio spartinae]
MEQSPFLRIQPLAEAPPFDWASLPFVEEVYERSAKDKQKVVEKKSKKIRKGTNYNHKIQSPSDGYNVISSFRKKAGLQPYSSTSGDTVAFIEINGKKFFGVNSQITKTSQVSQKALREKWMKEVEWVPPKKNKPKHLGQVQSLTHGESHSLIRAYERLGNQLPKELSMYVDRKTCNMCRGEMPALLKRLGVDKLNIYSGGSTKPIVLESIKL